MTELKPGRDQVLRIRRDLASAINDQRARKGLTQLEAAKITETHQSLLSDINRYKLDAISIDKLLKIATDLGIKLDWIIS